MDSVHIQVPMPVTNRNAPTTSPGSAAPTPRATYRHGDLRRALLDAGIELARHGGPDAVVLREATRRAGVAPNAAYRHFANRDDLLDAVRAAAVAAAAHFMEAELAQVPTTGTPTEQAHAKVRAVGASNFSVGRLAEALQVSDSLGLVRYESLQPLYNLYQRQEFEGDLASLCASEGLGVIPYFALAAGFLTGKYRTEADLAKSPRGRLAKNMLDARGLGILAALDAVAASLSASPAQVALAWLLARGATAPIASATTVAQLHEILGAATLKLDPSMLAALDRASG